jgi:gluconolactonase
MSLDSAPAPELVLSEPERLVTGATWAEGAVWLPATRRVRFSDIPGNRVLEWEEGRPEPIVQQADAEFPNGRTLDLDGSVLQCSHGRRAIERERDGVVTTLVDRWNGVRFNSPNDLVVASDGSILFTDPPYGIIKAEEGHPGEREYGDHYVFRFVPSTGEVRPIVLDVDEPNGLALSPDERILYVADTAEGFRADGRGDGHIRAYDVHDGWRVKYGRTLLRAQGVTDGFRVDVEGRIWTSAGAAVEVHEPDGTLLTRVPIPETVANVCFGGDAGTDLFIAASTSLYRLRTSTRDAADRTRR